MYLEVSDREVSLYNNISKTIIICFFFSLFSLMVNFSDEMVEQFRDEDDFIISTEVDSQNNHLDLCVHF